MRGRLTTLVVAGAMLVAAFFVAPAQADKRIALIIGNSNYQHAGLLANPANDVAAMAQMLRAAGFEKVDVRQNLGIRELRQAVGDFSDSARDADVALLFYAGHGIEVDGTNYLIPVDARLARDFDVEDEALSLDRILRAIEPAKRLRFVMLDACRDNPFVRTMKRATRSVGRGLARVEPAASDTLVAFATEAGTVAADGDALTSPFTEALLRHLPTPGLDVRLAFGRVRDDVMKRTNNRQRPFIYGSLGGSTIAIVDAPAVAPQMAQPQNLPMPATPDPCAAAEAHWKSAEAIGTRAAFADHISRFGNCIYAGLAAARIGALDHENEARLEGQKRAEAARKIEQERERIAAETARKKAEDRPRVAALPPAEKQPRSGSFDGTWTMTRSASPGCHGQAASFVVRINGSVAIGPGGRGSISPSGAIRVPGRANYFTGTLRGNSGGGTYSGKCSGTFTASRN